MGVAMAVLALDGFVGDTHVSTTVVACVAVVGSGARLLQLIASLSQLDESQIEARTDDLTGIANRRALSAALAEAVTDRQDAALVVVDLDHFKEINDQHGHGVGDELLRAMAERLRASMPADALLARIGGDEFAVLLLGAASRDAAEVAEIVLGLCAEPIETTAGWMSLGASIGVATTAGNGDHVVDLMRRADTAMYVAKRRDGGVAHFDEDADRATRRDRDLLAELRWLLGPEASDQDRRQFQVHFQPQLSARTGDVAGVEALVRWRHPEHGVLFPARVPRPGGAARAHVRADPDGSAPGRRRDQEMGGAGPAAEAGRQPVDQQPDQTPACCRWWTRSSRSTGWRPPSSPWRSPRPR